MVYDTADFYKIIVQEISESDINKLLKLAFEKGGKEEYFFLSGVSKSLGKLEPPGCELSLVILPNRLCRIT